jgi:uncharacterized membrane protein YidH (DUF202 family)
MPANERTFLGYLRTSQICSMMGVFIAQFFRLQHSSAPNPILGFYVVSIPLSGIFQILAILVLLIGAARFFKLQKTMALGKAISGGWELLVVGGLSFAVSFTIDSRSKEVQMKVADLKQILVTLAVLVLAITIEKD